MAHQPEKAFIWSRQDPDDWTDEWFREIGWVGYYFGQMEWTPYLPTDRVGCSKTQRRKMPTMSFAERCKFAKTHLLPKLTDPVLRNEWADTVDEVSKCGKLRNDILHNPLELNVSEIEACGIKVNQGIRLLKKGGKILPLGDVRHFSRTMIDLHKRIVGLLARTPLCRSPAVEFSPR